MNHKEPLPLVSIVTPVYNGSKFLEEMIESAIDQTYKPIEHIVIDDGSNDEGRTLAILKRYPQIRWWTRPNIGQYATQNEGFRAASGDWVTCNGQDDRFHDRHAIEAAMTHAAQHPGAEVIHGLTRHIDQNGLVLPVQPPQNFPYWPLQYCLTFSHCSLFVRSSSLLTTGVFFNEYLRNTGDADWIFRLQLAGLRFSRLNRVVSDYRHHPDQLTSIADVDSSASHLRAKELRRLEQLYGRSRLVRRLVLNWVTFEKRKRALSAMLRGYRRHDDIWERRH